MRSDDGIVDEKLDFKTVHIFVYSGTRERETLTLCQTEFEENNPTVLQSNEKQIKKQLEFSRYFEQSSRQKFGKAQVTFADAVFFL